MWEHWYWKGRCQDVFNIEPHVSNGNVERCEGRWITLLTIAVPRRESRSHTVYTGHFDRKLFTRLSRWIKLLTFRSHLGSITIHLYLSSVANWRVIAISSAFPPCIISRQFPLVFFEVSSIGFPLFLRSFRSVLPQSELVFLSNNVMNTIQTAIWFQTLYKERNCLSIVPYFWYIK